MAEVVNLRNFRKQKNREEKAAAAQVTRAAFGRTKSEKKSQTELSSRADNEGRDYLP